MIDLDTALGQQLLDIAIREAVAKVPAHREDDDLPRETEALEGRTRDRGYRTTTRPHAATMTGRYDLRQCNRPSRNASRPTVQVHQINTEPLRAISQRRLAQGRQDHTR